LSVSTRLGTLSSVEGAGDFSRSGEDPHVSPRLPVDILYKIRAAMQPASDINGSATA